MEEKPDVTYSDVGGCKEQIEKLREVVETPLLHVSIHITPSSVSTVAKLLFSQKSMSILALTHLRECYYLAPQELGKPCVLELLLTVQMPVSSG